MIPGIKDYVNELYNGYGSTILISSEEFNIFDPSPILGFCSLYESDNGNKIYKLFHSITKSEKLNEIIETHEYGHIYLGHLNGIHEDLDKNLIEIIHNRKSELINIVNSNCNIDYADKILDKVISDKGFNHLLHNMAMDMEVNSVVLDSSDVESFYHEINGLVNNEINNPSNNNMEINDVMSLISKMKMKIVSPLDFEFEEGLTYPDYLVLLILNLDKVVNLTSNLSSQNQNSSGESDQDSQGDGNSKSIKGMTSNSSNVPKTEEEFNKMIDSMNEDPKKDEDHSSESRSEMDSFKSDKSSKEIEDEISKGNSHSSELREYKVNNDPLDLALNEIVFNLKNKVIKRDFSKDLTYKSNRRILGKSSNVLNPTYKLRITKSYKPSIAFYIDVSGSMRRDLIDRIITQIKSGIKKIDPSLVYNIITWDTELCQFYKNITCKSPIPRISSGGGTSLSRTFVHFRENFDKTSIMVLISDFEDSLGSWRDQEETMGKYSMYGLKYGRYMDKEIKNGYFKNFKVRKIE